MPLVGVLGREALPYWSGVCCGVLVGTADGEAFSAMDLAVCVMLLTQTVYSPCGGLHSRAYYYNSVYCAAVWVLRTAGSEEGGAKLYEAQPAGQLE